MVQLLVFSLEVCAHSGLTVDQAIWTVSVGLSRPEFVLALHGALLIRLDYFCV